MPDLNANDDYRPQVLTKLKQAIRSNHDALQIADKAAELSRVAWTARNLLELWTWTDYCIASKENARTFLVDCARDALEVVKIPQNLSAPGYNAEATHQSFLEIAKQRGIQDIDEPYKRVSNAAKEFGKGEDFGFANKLLSKFAHPTAMLVMTELDKPLEEKLRAKFREFGILCVENSLAQIERFESNNKAV